VEALLNGLANPALWEGLAVVLAVAYLLLAARENSLCWYFAFVHTAIYTALFWQVSLLMESALNVYYMAMAVFGWYQWRRGGESHRGVEIHCLGLSRHFAIVALILLVTVVSGSLLSRYSDAAWPYVDSFTTWASVITTYMVTRKILENWLYWVLIDAVSIPLYIDRGLTMTALLYAAYVVIAAMGYLSWRRHFLRLQQQQQQQQRLVDA
jgi:nicotinamide mononucleotide transporter